MSEAATLNDIPEDAQYDDGDNIKREQGIFEFENIFFVQLATIFT